MRGEEEGEGSEDLPAVPPAGAARPVAGAAHREHPPPTAAESPGDPRSTRLTCKFIHQFMHSLIIPLNPSFIKIYRV